MTGIQEQPSSENSPTETPMPKKVNLRMLSIVFGVSGFIVSVALNALSQEGGDDLINTFIFAPLLFLIAIFLFSMSIVFGAIWFRSK